MKTTAKWARSRYPLDQPEWLPVVVEPVVEREADARLLVHDHLERYMRLDPEPRELTPLGDRLVEKVASLERLARDRLDVDQQAEVLDREHRRR